MINLASQIPNIPKLRPAFEVRGKNRVIANLRWLDDAYLTALIGQVNTSLAVIYEGARRRAPVRTGQLRSKIKATQAKLYRSGNWRGYVRSRAPYAAWVEFGAGRGRKGARKVRRRAAYQHGSMAGAVAAGAIKQYQRPYLGPAFVEERPRFVRRVMGILESVPRRLRA